MNLDKIQAEIAKNVIFAKESRKVIERAKQLNLALYQAITTNCAGNFYKLFNVQR